MADLDKEEKELLDSYERDEWKPVANQEAEAERHRGYARSAIEKIRGILENRSRRIRRKDSSD